MFPSLGKMGDDPIPGLLSPSQWASLKWAAEPLLWKPGKMVSYFSRKAGRSPGMSHGPEGLPSWSGSAVHPPPLWQATFLLFTSCQDWVAWLCPDTMPLWRRKESDHEIGLKFSVYTWCPVALCFKWECFVRLRSHSEVLTTGPGSESKRWACLQPVSCRIDFWENIPSEYLTKVYLWQSKALAATLLPRNGSMLGCRLWAPSTKDSPALLLH